MKKKEKKASRSPRLRNICLRPSQAVAENVFCNVRVKTMLYPKPSDDTDDATPINPCRWLLSAIIERAVLDLRSPDPAIEREAKEWFTSHSRKAFSFLWIMDQLGWKDVTWRLLKYAKRFVSESTNSKRTWTINEYQFQTERK